MPPLMNITPVKPDVNLVLTQLRNTGGTKKLIEMFCFWSHKEQEVNKAVIAARERV